MAAAFIMAEQKQENRSVSAAFSIYYIHNLLKKRCYNFIESAVFFLPIFSLFFVRLIRMPFYFGEKQQMRQRDKGLAQPLPMNRVDG